jgi:hypothetical protein
LDYHLFNWKYHYLFPLLLALAANNPPPISPAPIAPAPIFSPVDNQSGFLLSFIF